jgi:hypothetical protein
MPKRVITKRLSLRPGRTKRLGRHIEHDSRSWYYQAPRAPRIRSVLHRSYGLPLNQGLINSCAGNAVAGLLMTTPFHRRGRALTEGDALDIYRRATHGDSFPGTFPTSDPGSSGLAAMKVARELGYARGYGHAFGLEHALQTLVLAPVITGVYWYDSFDNPRKRDTAIHKRGRATGGHEFLVVGIDTETQMVRACNSWGPDWGDHGCFQFSWYLWEELLYLHGDVTTAIVAPGRRSPPRR